MRKCFIELIFVAIVLALHQTNSLSFMKKELLKRSYEATQNTKITLEDSEQMWIEQKLNNFDPTDRRSWHQRYFMQTKFSQSNGPVFLQIGGEGPASAVWMNNGHWIEMAKKFKALCFQLEHRYYGLSQPTKNMSLSNLVYLSSEQALADLSYFIVAMKKKFSLENRKWIVFGGSYPGSLAIWARLKYPHLIDGAVSASAPLNAFVDFSAYNKVVQHSLNELGDKNCSQRIALASKLIAEKLNLDERNKLSEMFQTCKPLNTFDDEYFQQSLADNIAEVVQYNRDNRNFEDKKPTMTISEVCSRMKDHSCPLQSYAAINNLILEVNGVKCFDASYAKYLEDMTSSSWSAAPSSRQWVYQTCTEFGWYQTASTSTLQPFQGFPISFFERECKLLFNIDKKTLQESVERTNTKYGNVDVVLKVTNTSLYNGLIDPWSNMSYVGQFASSTVPIEVVSDTAHCAIMYPSSSKDSEGLKQARVKVENELRKWL